MVTSGVCLVPLHSCVQQLVSAVHRKHVLLLPILRAISCCASVCLPVLDTLPSLRDDEILYKNHRGF